MTARGTVRIAGLILALGLAGASPAASQIEPLLDSDPVVLPGIEVAAFGGPPWWTVSDADSTVYILASPGAPVASWDTALLEQRLKGAKRLILQPDMKAGIFVARTQLATLAGAMLMWGGSTRLEGGLLPVLDPKTGRVATPDPSLSHFRDVRQKAGMPEARYGGLPLTLASFALAGDVYERLPYADLPGEPVEQTATRIAEAHKVPVGPAISYGDKDWLYFLSQMRAPDETCISATLEDLEQAPARVRALTPDRIKAITEPWSHGDVTPLIAAFRDGSNRAPGITLHVSIDQGTAALTVASPVCLRQIPIYRQISDRWLTDETDAVVKALKTPGKTVIVYRATDLLFVGGVLDQLAKRGLSVKAPKPRDE